ncbi:MAG: DUF1566 domain-containing protein [Deltaproteobacteria bacterium]|nr:DUF1566 domain-containing protein [Deltaproteobacteria bacterium]
MKTLFRFPLSLALTLVTLLFLYPGLSVSQDKATRGAIKTKTIEALIKDLNPHTKVLTIDEYPGTIIYNKTTVFLAGAGKVSPSAARTGTKATITYTESLGAEDPPGSGIRPVSGLATRIVLHIPLETAQQAPEISNRFVDNRDGTITDTKTKLMWQKNDDGKKRTWKEAQDYVRNLRLAGHKDWRLPDTKEHDPAIVMELKGKKRSEGRADWYWSSDQKDWIPFNYPATHLLVGPMTSLGEPKDTDRAFVRCVRELK